VLVPFFGTWWSTFSAHDLHELPNIMQKTAHAVQNETVICTRNTLGRAKTTLFYIPCRRVVARGIIHHETNKS
jgi:hypothetical protein